VTKTPFTSVIVSPQEDLTKDCLVKGLKPNEAMSFPMERNKFAGEFMSLDDRNRDKYD
jgi:hypothetical protein